MKRLNALLADESGATALEYAFIASLVSIAATATMIALGTRVTELFQQMVDAF